MSNGSSPPAFAWESWYAAVGDRSIPVDEVDHYLRKIFEDQYPRFEGQVAAERYRFEAPADASSHLKEKAKEFGADIVGIAAIEPSDVYRGRTVSEKFAIAVGQRMRWREFQVEPSRESAIHTPTVRSTCRSARTTTRSGRGISRSSGPNCFPT